MARCLARITRWHADGCNAGLVGGAPEPRGQPMRTCGSDNKRLFGGGAQCVTEQQSGLPLPGWACPALDLLMPLEDT